MPPVASKATLYDPTLSALPGCVATYRCVASHSLTVSSPPPLAKMPPVASKATLYELAYALPACAATRPLATSHSLIVLSSLPLAKVPPVGSKATLLTLVLCVLPACAGTCPSRHPTAGSSCHPTATPASARPATTRCARSSLCAPAVCARASHPAADLAEPLRILGLNYSYLLFLRHRSALVFMVLLERNQ